MLRRRELLKLWAAGGAVALLPISYQRHQKLGLNKAFAKDFEFQSFAFQSPAVTPFIDPLPRPRVIEPLRDSSGNLAAFEAPEWADYIEEGKTSFYKVVSEERQVQFHSELPPTTIWGYRPEYVPHGEWNFVMGPTFKTHICQDMHAGLVVQHINNLPHEVEGFGHPETSIHLHGGHHPSRSDGFPGNIDGQPNFLFKPGEHYNYCYPMLDVGVIDEVIEPSERPSTLWYHDHAEDFTAANVYKGLAGFHLVYESPNVADIDIGPLDTGDENNERGLHLPSGDFDIPLALQDKSFMDDGSLFYNSFDHDGFLGDKFIVNGAIQPYLEVKRRKYRFRFLNASNARFYKVFLINENGRSQRFDMIGNEGGLFDHTLRDQENFFIGMAERYEIVVDFSHFSTGDVLYFEDRLGQDDGRGPDGDFERPRMRKSTRFLKLIVGEEADDPSEVPDTLRPLEPVPPEILASAEVKTFEFERSQGVWQINNQFFYRNEPLAVSQRGMPEIWRLVNKSGGWWHPIHIHSEFGRVITRNGKLPPLHERDGIARKDTFVLGPNDEVEVFLRFRDYSGPFVFHCHNLEHEDMFMMGRFDIV